MSEHTKGQLTPNIVGHFDSYQQWANKGASWLASPQYRGAMCVDAKGRRVAIGADFMRARDEKTFPVYFFWDCEPQHGESVKDELPELAAANARIAKLEALVSERDAMLGKRPCQNNRCNELNAARALLREVLEVHDAASSYDLQGIFVDEFASKIRAHLDACDTLEGK
mgnify:CR=1 FL=1